MSSTKVILVPTDFGDSAELALDHAIEIARVMKARIVLLYSCPTLYLSSFDGAIVPNADVVESMRDAGRRGLAQSIGRHLHTDVEIRPLSTLGDPRTCILEVAKETGADLIVMGTHGRRGLSRLLLGSTAEAIVRTSPIPVLTVHAPVVAKEVSAQSARQA